MITERISPKHFGVLKKTLLFILSIGLLTAGFSHNLWKATPQDQFLHFQHDSESLVIGRLVKARSDGIFSDGAFSGRGDFPEESHWEEASQHQYQTFFNGGTFTTFHPYKSHAAVQTWVYSLLDSTVDASSHEKLNIFRFLTAFMSAMVLSCFLAWFFEEFGLMAASFVLICMMYSMWITLFARNLWWATGAFFIPVISMAFFLKQDGFRHHYSNFTAMVIAFLSLFTKCLFNGFEFITTTIIMMISPFIYYAVKCQWTLSALMSRIVMTGLACAGAIMCYLGLLLHQLSKIEGSYTNGLRYIYDRIAHRTYYFDPSGGIRSGHTTTLTSVLNDYADSLLMSFEWVMQDWFPFPEFLSLKAWQLIGILAVVTLVAQTILNGRRTDEMARMQGFGLLAASWFSLIAPLSWLIIFKSHSAIHLHMNSIIWHMPFALFSFAAFGFLIQKLWPHYQGKRTAQ